MPNVRVRVGVVLPRHDHLLLIRHRKGEQTYWLLPGGGLEFGEPIEACAEREVKEETGLDVTIIRPLFVSEAIAPNGERHMLQLTLLAEERGGSLAVGRETVLDEVAFLPFAELPRLDLRPPMHDALQALWESQFKLPLTYLGQLWR